jgi:hypothetical protein
VTFNEQLSNTVHADRIDKAAANEVARTVRNFRKRLELVMAKHVNNSNIVERVFGRVEEHLIQIAELVTAEFK